MANGLVERASLQDIADAIREKNGTLNTYTPAEMGDAVRALGDNLPDLDLISFGEQSSLPEKGKTNPQYYEEIARAIRIRLSLNARLVVISPVGSTLTVTGGGATQTTTSTGNDTFIIEAAGEYTVAATSGSDTASATVSITSYGQSESVTLTYFAATINVTAPVGSTVTVALGGTTVDTHTGTGTAVAVVVHEAGTYDVTAAGDGKTASDTVTIATSGQTESVVLEFIPDVLNDATWAQISAVSEVGEAANYWSVGDTKSVALSGTVGTLTVSGSYDVFIIGFNHKGVNGITFQGFKASGTDVCLCDSYYNSYQSYNGTKYFQHNHWGPSDYGKNYGGWKGSELRYDILGSTNVAPSGYGSANSSASRVGYDPTNYDIVNSPVANTLMSCLPAALRAVMRPITVYTDNVGNSSNVNDHISASVDYLPLLAEFEIFGARTYANEYEQNYPAQYDYYKNGNSKVKYRHNATTATAAWWERSPFAPDDASFCRVLASSGAAGSNYASASRGLAPAFCV